MSITAAEFAREVIASLRRECKWASKRRRQQDLPSERRFFEGRATGLTIALEKVRDFAHEHNIDLSEPKAKEDL